MKEIDYVVENAAFVAHRHVSKKLSKKFTVKDIIEVLNAKNDWADQYDLIPDSKKSKDYQHPVNVVIDQSLMIDFVANQCASKGLVISYNEIVEIIRAEDIYFEAILGTSFEDDILKYSVSKNQ